jgi:hypothetical protein
MTPHAAASRGLSATPEPVRVAVTFPCAQDGDDLGSG